MKTHVDYLSFGTQIEKLKVAFDKDHYVRFEPKQKAVIVDEVEIIENYVNITIVDKSLMHEVCTEASIDNLKELIFVFQTLAKQIQNKNNTKGGNCS
jgi:hypothetical protein